MSKTDKIKIGDSEAGPVYASPTRLNKTRVLVTANSGGGKSWLMRLLLEQLGQRHQIIVLDDEGEYRTLREKLDLLLVGEGGELPCQVRSAHLLARRLLEMRISAVIDLSELQLDARRDYVKTFLTSMIEAPRKLWHPCFVALDETQRYCPERGQGEASSSEAVMALATLGRKRRFCPIYATQRLSKLRKDAVAECRTQFIGLTNFEDDQKRAAPSLGIKPKDAVILSKISPPGREGEFYGFGPGLLSPGVTFFRAGQVETTHGDDLDAAQAKPPEPSKKILGLLGELKDLPQEAEAEIKDLAAARAKIDQLQRDIRALGKAPLPAETKKQLLDATEKTRRDSQIIKQLRRGLEAAMKVMQEIQTFEALGVDQDKIRKVIDNASAQILQCAQQALSKRAASLDRFKREVARTMAELQKLLDTGDAPTDITANAPPHQFPREAPANPAHNYEVSDAQDPAGRKALSDIDRDILDTLAGFPHGATKQRISVFSGRSLKSSSFQQAFSEKSANAEKPSLFMRGLIGKSPDDKYFITDAARPLAVAISAKTLADWVQKLTDVEGDVLSTIAAAHPTRLTRAQVAEKSGRSGSSSSFQGAFAQLRDLGLIDGKKDFGLTTDFAENL